MFIITRFFGIWDNLFTSKYERRIFRKSRELVESNQIQYVFSVCKPFYAHRIAKKIQNKYGIIWYQFWVDPYSKTFRNVLGLSKLLANNFEKQYIEHSDKVFSLPEVFSDAEISGAKNRINRFEIPYVINRDVSYKGKDIIFAGSFIKRLREPAPVLNLILDSLSLLDHDVRFLFFVKNRTQLIKYEELSKGRIVFKDFIPHDSLYELLRDSYMLLNIGNAGSIQMPSKTVEYVSFRKPLLFFFSDKNDASLRYLNPYPDICMVNVNDDSESNIKKLVAFINAKHIVLSYEELMKIPIYYESTPEYVSSLMR